MPIYQLNDKVPDIAETAWVADTAQIIGDVRLGAGASVWFNTVTTTPLRLVQAATFRTVVCCPPMKAFL